MTCPLQILSRFSVLLSLCCTPALAQSITFPATVSGTVNSGGIPCFNSATNMETTAALPTNYLLLGGGSGGCVTASNTLPSGTGGQCPSGTNTTIYCVDGVNITSITDAYTMATGAGQSAFVIYDYNLANEPVMYCTPWKSDGNEVAAFTLYLGPGTLQFSNHQSSGAACASYYAVFATGNNSQIWGTQPGSNSGDTTGTVIQAYSASSSTNAMWTSAASTNCPTTLTCLMPVAAAGDWTNSTYTRGAQLNYLTIDCNYLPGTLGIEAREAQEDSWLYFVSAKNCVQEVYWHGSQAQNFTIVQFYDNGCASSTYCLIDSTTNRFEMDNVPVPRAWHDGTLNPVNTYNTTYTGGSVSGSAGAYTITLKMVSNASLSTPTAPTVTSVGGSTGSYSYEIACLQTFTKTTAASAAGSTTTGPTTLSTSAYNVVTLAAESGAATCKIYRTAGGGSQGYIGSMNAGSAFYDIGYPASSVDTTAPSSNTTGIVSGDWVALHSNSGWTTEPQGVYSVTTGTSSSQIVVSSNTTPGTCSSCAGTLKIVPATELNFCVGSNCFDMSTAIPSALKMYDVHLENCAYCINVDSSSGTNATLNLFGNSTVATATSTDAYDLIHIPALALKNVNACGNSGVATNSIYDDANRMLTLPSGTTSDGCDLYTMNGQWNGDLWPAIVNTSNTADELTGNGSAQYFSMTSGQAAIAASTIKLGTHFTLNAMLNITSGATAGTGVIEPVLCTVAGCGSGVKTLASFPAASLCPASHTCAVTLTVQCISSANAGASVAISCAVPGGTVLGQQVNVSGLITGVPTNGILYFNVDYNQQTESGNTASVIGAWGTVP